MKLAILGSSPIALETAVRFHTHGAALTWFNMEDSWALEKFSSHSFEANTFTSAIGLGLLAQLGKKYAPTSFSWSQWKEDYYLPLAQYLSAQQSVRSQEVVSVTKRYLGLGEEIPGKSRFFDLFRVIYLVNPRQFIDQQKESDPETYKKLSAELVGSLQSTIEMFEDFDLVMDFRSSLAPGSIAASGRALGEKRMSSEKILYGLDVLSKLNSVISDPEVREVALIGSHALAAEVLIQLESWLKDPRSRLFLITTEEEPFQKFLQEGHPDSTQKYNRLLAGVEASLEADFSDFHHKLRQWQELDDFVQVKIPKPAEPIPQVNFFSGHNATAIDELIDRQRLFLTLEKPEFRQGKKHPDNNRLELKTIGVDRVLVATELTKVMITPSLHPQEPGYFNLVSALPSLKQGWINELNELKGFEDEVFKLFSLAAHH